MSRRYLQGCTWLIVLFIFVLLGGCAVHSASVTWNQPSSRWFTDNPPLLGICEAVAMLQNFRAELPNTPSNPLFYVLLRQELTREIAAERSLQIVRDEIGQGARLSLPLLVFLDLNGESALVWVIVAELPGNARLPNAVIALVNGDDGSIFRVTYAATAADPASCPFDTTGVLLQIARTPISIMFIAYSALIIGFMSWNRRRLRRLKENV